MLHIQVGPDDRTDSDDFKQDRAWLLIRGSATDVQPTVQPRTRTLADGGRPSYTASLFVAGGLGDAANL